MGSHLFLEKEAVVLSEIECDENVPLQQTTQFLLVECALLSLVASVEAVGSRKTRGDLKD